jgi:nucleoside-diphosphate-sugar epimerase
MTSQPQQSAATSSHATSNILVIGGTGAQGIPIVSALVADKKYAVRVLSRDSTSPRAKALFELGNVSLLIRRRSHPAGRIPRLRRSVHQHRRVQRRRENRNLLGDAQLRDSHRRRN